MEASAQSGVSRREERIPFDALVELCAGDGTELIEADGINLSIGGMALRSSFVPPLGAVLECRFQCPPDGELVSAQGEVTWVADRGPELGSFGVRFIGLDTKSASALRRCLRDSAPPEPDGLRAASLHIDGLGAAVDTELRLADETRIVLEQQLPFLQLGRGVEVQVLGRGTERGRIASVELRHTDLDVPTLVFGILLDEAPEADAEPVGASAGPLFGDVTGEVEDYDDSAESQALQTAQAAAREALEPAEASESTRAVAPRNVRRREGRAESAERESVMSIPPDPLQAAAGALKAYAARARLAVRGGYEKLRALLLPALREQAVALELPDAKARLLFRLARLRALLLSRGRGARRTTTKPPPLRVQRSSLASDAAHPALSQRVRWAALGLFVVGGALIAYALLTRSPELPPPEPVVAAAEPAAAPEETPPAPSEEAAEPVSTEPFGDPDVPNGRVFVFRLDGPITEIRGEALEDGFKVRIPRRASRDGARHLAGERVGVARAMIKNHRPKYAELSVYFLPGISPRYRVRGQGDTLELTIERIEGAAESAAGLSPQ